MATEIGITFILLLLGSLEVCLVPAACVVEVDFVLLRAVHPACISTAYRISRRRQGRVYLVITAIAILMLRLLRLVVYLLNILLFILLLCCMLLLHDHSQLLCLHVACCRV